MSWERVTLPMLVLKISTLLNWPVAISFAFTSPFQAAVAGAPATSTLGNCAKLADEIKSRRTKARIFLSCKNFFIVDGVLVSRDKYKAQHIFYLKRYVKKKRPGEGALCSYKSDRPLFTDHQFFHLHAGTGVETYRINTVSE